jgi:predicted ABC-type exoprotein transport system permease subunit
MKIYAKVMNAVQPDHVAAVWLLVLVIGAIHATIKVMTQ